MVANSVNKFVTVPHSTRVDVTFHFINNINE